VSITYQVTITDIINVILVAVLVGATIFYALRTHSMVKEMREARYVQILPKLKLGIEMITLGRGSIKITNAGTGPAINVVLEFWLGNEYENKRVWTNSLLVQSESVQFLFPKINNQYPKLDQICDTWQTVSMKASYADAMGRKFEISDSFDIKDYWEKTKSSVKRWQDTELREIQKIKDELKKIADNTSKISALLENFNSIR
jgi:hypothetical protein